LYYFIYIVYYSTYFYTSIVYWVLVYPSNLPKLSRKRNLKIPHLLSCHSYNVLCFFFISLNSNSEYGSCIFWLALFMCVFRHLDILSFLKIVKWCFYFSIAIPNCYRNCLCFSLKIKISNSYIIYVCYNLLTWLFYIFILTFFIFFYYLLYFYDYYLLY